MATPVLLLRAMQVAEFSAPESCQLCRAILGRMGVPERLEIFQHRMNELFWFILSKDRPLQLDALLRSLDAMVDVTAQCVVLYKASSERYERAYAAVFDRHRHMHLDAVPEQDFQADVCNIIGAKHYERVTFLVDDQVFVAPVNLKKILTLDPNFATYSLRLGKKITRCQPLNIETGNPPFLQLEDRKSVV